MIKFMWAGGGGLLLSLVDVGWVLLFILGVGDGVLPGERVGDQQVEVVVEEGVLLGLLDHKCGIVGWAEVFPVGGKRLVFGFEVDLDCINLIF